MVTLLQHVEKVIDLSRQRRDEKAQRQPEESKPKEPKPLESAKEVTEEIRARLAKLLFGPDGEANASASMKRLLDSWVVMGYPEEGKQHGTVVDYIGRYNPFIKWPMLDRSYAANGCRALNADIQ